MTRKYRATLLVMSLFISVMIVVAKQSKVAIASTRSRPEFNGPPYNIYLPLINKPVPPFAPQPGNPVRIPNIANDLGCEWMGVGGQVFSLQNEPIANLGVHLEGELDGSQLSLDTITGSAPELGPSGYVIDLADRPIASDDSLWVQLNDGGGVTLSDIVVFSTSDQCDENFVMINWRQVWEL